MERRKYAGIVLLIIILCFELAWLGGSAPPAAVKASPPAATPSPTPSPTPLPTPEPTPSPTPLPLPPEDEMWKLAIASADYPLEGEYEVETVPVGTGYLFDARAAEAL